MGRQEFLGHDLDIISGDFECKIDCRIYTQTTNSRSSWLGPCLPEMSLRQFVLCLGPTEQADCHNAVAYDPWKNEYAACQWKLHMNNVTHEIVGALLVMTGWFSESFRKTSSPPLRLTTAKPTTAKPIRAQASPSARTAKPWTKNRDCQNPQILQISALCKMQQSNKGSIPTPDHMHDASTASCPA